MDKSTDYSGEDFVDVLIRVQRREDLVVPITDDKLKAFDLVLFTTSHLPFTELAINSARLGWLFRMMFYRLNFKTPNLQLIFSLFHFQKTQILKIHNFLISNQNKMIIVSEYSQR